MPLPLKDFKSMPTAWLGGKMDGEERFCSTERVERVELSVQR